MVMKPVTLYTTLDIEECRRRLRAEFPHPRRVLNQAVSDRDLRGSLSGHTVVIGLWRTQVEEMFALGSVALTLQRAFTAQLHASGSGTRIIGRYSAEREAGALLTRVLLFCFAAIVGIMLLLAGVINAVRGSAGGSVALAGVLILAASVLLLAEPDDRQYRREQERIVRFLERVLEAERVGAASGN